MAYFVFARHDISHLLTRCTDSIDHERERNLSLMTASVYVGMSLGCRVFACLRKSTFTTTGMAETRKGTIFFSCWILPEE